MLSSIANRLYWMGRNLERVEAQARLFNVYAELLLDLPKDASIGWETLVRITGAEEDFLSSRHWGMSNAVLRYLAADQANPNSMYNCIGVARENVRTLRDVVPREAFESINDLYLFAQKKLSRQAYVRIRFAILREIMERCQQISGLFQATMSRGYEYEFLQMGCYIERADMTTRILDVAGAAMGLDDEQISDHDTVVWISVLASASAYQSYRQSVRSRVTPVRVLHFLLNDLHFPRSVRFCLHEVLRATEVLPRGEVPKLAVQALLDRMDGTTLKSLVSTDLHGSLDLFQQEIIAVHGAISATWFEHHMGVDDDG